MSRGKKKPKLRDLSTHPLTDQERSTLTKTIIASNSPISEAILGAVLVEHELEAVLRRRFAIKDDKIWEKMLGEMGPLSTFSRKILMGHSLRIYDDDFRHNLDIVRAVRNAFAHSKRVLDFKNPLVVDELNSIKIPKTQRRAFRKISKMTTRTAYVCLCLQLAGLMMQRQNRAVAKSNRRKQKKLTSSAFYRAIAPTLGISGDLAGSRAPWAGGLLGILGGLPPLPSRPDQTGGPKTVTPPATMGGLLGLGAEALRKKGSKE